MKQVFISKFILIPVGWKLISWIESSCYFVVLWITHLAALYLHKRCQTERKYQIRCIEKKNNKKLLVSICTHRADSVFYWWTLFCINDMYNCWTRFQKVLISEARHGMVCTAPTSRYMQTDALNYGKCTQV